MTPRENAPPSADPPSRGHRASALVWMALLVAGLGVGIWSLAQTELKPEKSTREAWMNGSAETAINQSLRLPGQSWIEMASAATRYRFLGDLGEQVVLGCPQWMFYHDGLRAQPGTAPEVVQQRLQLLEHWHDRLQARNVKTLVVAVPDKARVENEYLCGRTMSRSMQARYDELSNGLSKRSIPFADLRATLEKQPEDMYFRTDVHMNAAGAQRAAHAVAAQAIALLGGQRGDQRFDISAPSAPAPRMGDLLVLSGLKDAPEGWRPEIESAPSQTITPVRSGGLLDDTPPPRVLLAGSSNGLRSNFAEWLGNDLGQEVWNLSMDGGQFAGAMIKALKQESSWPQSLQLVIWEFSENTLSLPLTDDEKKALKEITVPVLAAASTQGG
ncbi:alginate O-acetyltransferase AlgX-related protein [Diaphorobacter caeni]|uniref:alginate O-acetyltransferase AlgX-related protein n=1 Tax=Diaphorobacter caeni TaxID=2784387 RepID=UPI00188E5132|nr:cell division protein FtsQ [Diaphorobacter caeni]MBF5007705.1 cell division protein FtsQ [Diaphorobacter caeni]